MFHYTYQVTVSNPTDARRFYIGVRSSDVKPEDDVYFGSCRPFKRWQEANGTGGLVKQVLAVWPTRNDALLHEILLHDCFDVAKNPEFWNQVKQTAESFDCTGVPKAPEHAKKIGRPGEKHWAWGKKLSQETKAKMSASRSGSNNFRYGKPLPEDLKKKISEAQKGEKAWRYGKKYPEMGKKISMMFKGVPKKKATCPHCGLFGSVNNLKRYHFDNCKEK